MDINLLQTFILVAKEGGFRSAAEKQFLTPSAISSRIRLLENEIGAQLFERGQFGTHLTLSGERLLDHAEDMLATWNRIRKDVVIPKQARKVLAIGATDTIWQAILLDAVSQMQQHDPTLALRMETGTAESLTREVLEGSLDAICIFEAPDLPVLHGEVIGDIQFILVSTNPLASESEAMAQHFVQVDWGKNRGQSLLEIPASKTHPMTRTSVGWLGLQWLLKNGGSAYLPQSLVAPYMASNMLFPVKNAPTFKRTVYLLHPIQARNNPPRHGANDLNMLSQVLVNIANDGEHLR